MTVNYERLNADCCFYRYKPTYILCPNGCHADNTSNLVANYVYLLLATDLPKMVDVLI